MEEERLYNGRKGRLLWDRKREYRGKKRHRAGKVRSAGWKNGGSGSMEIGSLGIVKIRCRWMTGGCRTDMVIMKDDGGKGGDRT